MPLLRVRTVSRAGIPLLLSFPGSPFLLRERNEWATTFGWTTETVCARRCSGIGGAYSKPIKDFIATVSSGFYAPAAVNVAEHRKPDLNAELATIDARGTQTLPRVRYWLAGIFCQRLMMPCRVLARDERQPFVREQLNTSRSASSCRYGRLAPVITRPAVSLWSYGSKSTLLLVATVSLA